MGYAYGIGEVGCLYDSTSCDDDMTGEDLFKTATEAAEAAAECYGFSRRIARELKRDGIYYFTDREREIYSCGDYVEIFTPEY